MTYDLSRDKMYSCFMDEVGVVNGDLTYQTKEAYIYKKPALVEVSFKTLSNNKTTVVSQAVKGGDWTITASRFIAVAENCAAKGA